MYGRADHIVKIASWMYSDNTIHLDRKYNKYREYEEIRKNLTDCQIQWDAKEIEILKDCIDKKMKPKEIIKKPFYDDQPMVWSRTRRKWYVISREGEWLEFGAEESEIKWKIIK